MKPILLATLLITMLAGCSGAAGFANEASIAGQGQMTGAHHRDVECGAKAQIAVGFQGQGNIEVKVRDGAGEVVYTASFSGQGQQGETKTLDGVEGDWKLTVSFSGIYGGYQGQYGVYLRC